uniref:Spore wall protein n=1 Tax=Ameson portunus TaxID=1477415 RepID=A0AB39IUS1_9MICR
MLNRINRTIFAKMNGPYQHAIFTDDFLEMEKNYKASRDSLEKIKTHIYFLMTYEFGGAGFKSIMENLEKISQSKMKSKNCFENLEKINRDLAHKISGENKEPVECIAENFMRINAEKRAFNGKLEELLAKIELLKAEVMNIDYLRNNLKDVQYKLEKCCRDNEDDFKRETFRSEFDQAMAKTRDEMEKFLDGNNFILIFKDLNSELKNYFKRSADVIKIN